MFFLYSFKNKHFGKKGKLQGQVFPFLLICIVALIIAAKISISAGKAATNKTCAATSADACSLAAGSVAATAFNTLVEDSLSLENDYIWYRENLFLELYNALGEFIVLGDGLLVSAINNVSGLNFAAAANDAHDAALNYGGAAAIVKYMEMLTENFEIIQSDNLCAYVSNLDDSLLQAESTGISYGFSNSCTASLSGDSDSFDFWLTTGRHAGETGSGSTDPVSGTRTYSWEGSGGQGCSSSVTALVPKIASHFIKATENAYPDLDGGYFDYDRVVNMAESAYQIYLDLSGVDITGLTDEEIDDVKRGFIYRLRYIFNTLSKDFKDRIDLVYNEVWQPADSASNVIPIEPESCASKKGMFIKFNENPSFDGTAWQVECSVSAGCEDSANAASSTAEFIGWDNGGGDLKVDRNNFAPEIIAAG